MPQPNLFIIGAPRSGTTALCAHLGRHHELFMSEPKEPYFWCDDFAGMRKRVGCKTVDQYEKLFAGAKQQTYLAEGSTLYLASDHAVDRILKYQPHARFIVMLRDPVELAYSFFVHLRFTQNEDCATFERAWGLQTQRVQGIGIPASCYEPRLLQYREIASIGSQLQRAMDCVPDGHLLALSQEQMQTEPRRVYLQILRFLQLDDDGRESIEHINGAATFRSGWAGRALQSTVARRALNAAKRGLPTALVNRVRAAKQRALVTPLNREPLPAKFRNQLADELAAEIALVQELTGHQFAPHRCSEHKVHPHRQEVARI